MRLKPLYLLSHIIFLLGFSIEHLLIAGFLGNWLINEPLSVSTKIEDFIINHYIHQKIANDPRYDKKTHVISHSYNKIVLLIGQVPYPVLKQQAYDYSAMAPKVKHIFNQIKIETKKTTWQSLQDFWITGKIKAQLLIKSNLRYHHFRILTENAEVFILGKTDNQDAYHIGLLAQQTKGVKQIIKLIETD